MDGERVPVSGAAAAAAAPLRWIGRMAAATARSLESREPVAAPAGIQAEPGLSFSPLFRSALAPTRFLFPAQAARTSQGAPVSVSTPARGGGAFALSPPPTRCCTRGCRSYKAIE